MVTANARPEKESYILVTFRHGDQAAPIFERYTDWQRDVEGYVSTPGLEVDIPDNVGSFDETQARVVLPSDDFCNEFAKPEYAGYQIYLQIEEVTAGLFAGDLGSRKTLWRGRIEKSTQNFQGRNNTTAWFSWPIKARLDVPLGIQCNHHCFWRLFSRGCGLVETDHRQFGEIATIDGLEVTISANAAITSPTSPGGNVDRFWERGYLEKDGLKIGVKVWELTDPTVFVLRNKPPDSWLLAGAVSVKFVPGCHKIIQDCRDVWDNEGGQGPTIGGGFMGAGYAMLPYNPIFEDPQ